MPGDVFVAIDFETADPKRDSACAVGLVRVEGGELVRAEVRLCRPPRGVDRANYQVHRLSWDRLRREPPFGAVWPALVPVLAGAGRLAAHNAAFDRSVLLASCAAAGLAPPELPWVCTLALARRRWPGQPCGLADVCGRLGVTQGPHHEAGADAEAAARVLLALEAADLADVGERAAGVARVFARARASGGRAVFGFDTRAASCARVAAGKVPPNFDRLAVAGDARWVALPRGDGADEPEPEEVPAAPQLTGMED